jgi:hypothetical protein
VVVIRGGAGMLIVIDSGFVTVACGTPESSSWKIGEDVPVACGVPLIRPDRLRFRPAGNEPLLRFHVKGDVPPVGLKANAYGWPIKPGGSGEGVRMANGAGAILTVIERVFWTDCPSESCNLNTVLLVPVSVGAPEMFPLDGVNTSPLGKAGDPGAKLQV